MAEPLGEPAATPGAADTLAAAGRGEAELARQLATLAYSAVVGSTGTALAAAVWWNGLLRLGLSPPLVAVHDLGLLLSRSRGLVLAPETARHRAGGPEAGVLLRYRALVEALTTTTLPSEADIEAAVGLRDELVVILLARLFGDLERRARAGANPAALLPPLPLASPLYARAMTMAAPGPTTVSNPRGLPSPAWALPFLRGLCDEQGIVILRLQQTELGVFRLFGVPQGGAGAGAPDLPALYQLANTVGAGQIADFSLQLLPSLLETKRAAAVQRFAVDGYASVERRGSVDALLPSELAQDPDTFAQRALGDELLYYGHERPHEGQRRSHGILIDASASMRGQREVVARGLGLALARKLGLLGGDVWLAFFDSRLHRRVDAAALAGRELPYFLCFRSERGRNYARVFNEVRDDLARTQRQGPRREAAITFITHGECHIPTSLLQTIRRTAAVFGIFVLPSQPLALDYLDLLSGHQVITPEAMVHPAERRRRALDVVSNVVAATGKT
jgi:hypothetical protein